MLTSVDDIELVALKAEVILHAADVGIVEIHAIEVVDPVHEAAEGQNENIELDNESPLGPCLRGLAPDHLAGLGEEEHGGSRTRIWSTARHGMAGSRLWGLRMCAPGRPDKWVKNQ